MADRRRLLAWFGYVAPSVSISFLFLSTLLDPKFSWRSRSLSSIGEATDTSVFALSSMNQVAFNLFNGGLFLAGILGLPFAVLLYREAQTRAERVGVGLLFITLLGNACVGITYVDGPYAAFHFPAAMTTFFGIGLTVWAYSTGAIQRTNADRGLGFFWVGNAYGLAWIIWIILEAQVFTGDGDTWTYFAVPEFLGALVLAAWIVVQARRIMRSLPAA